MAETNTTAVFAQC